ncbi:MAG: phosphatase PAP2 family protein [Thermoanaerobaculia bacterium]|nr:phosphatase PAP2 family protein [Thermoanaerobaculia bacterium]
MSEAAVALGRRILIEARYKLALLVGLTLGFSIGYFTLQQVTFFTPVTFSLTALDRAIGFAPSWIYAYQSLYILIPVPPLLTTRRSQLDVYTRGFVCLALAGFAIFAVYPVISPRPDGMTGVVAFDLLTRYEGKLNAFPSLHAGLAAYTLCYAYWALQHEMSARLRSALVVLGLLWGGVILYSTLATKQHYAVDLPAGVLLGWLSHRWSRTRLRTTNPPNGGTPA